MATELSSGFSRDHPIPSDRTNASPATERNTSLDFVKGALVLLMIVYHALNYFYHDRSILKYLHFLPTSFIFIAGFLITNIYLRKYEIRNPRLHKRLAVRGLKLVLLFSVLNIAAHLIASGNHPRRQLGWNFLISNIDSIFLTGEQRAAVFEVLLPIGYLMLLSAVFMIASRVVRHCLPVVSGITVILCLVLTYQESLVRNLDMLSMGLLGTIAGFTSSHRIDQITKSHWPFSIAFSAYCIAIKFQYPTYALNIVGVSLALLLLYSIAKNFTASGTVRDFAILLGQHSLFAYILQIGILQVLFFGARYVPPGSYYLFVALAVTLLLTVASVHFVDRLKSRSKFLGGVYRFVFF